MRFQGEASLESPALKAGPYLPQAPAINENSRKVLLSREISKKTNIVDNILSFLFHFSLWGFFLHLLPLRDLGKPIFLNSIIQRWISPKIFLNPLVTLISTCDAS